MQNKLCHQLFANPAPARLQRICKSFRRERRRVCLSRFARCTQPGWKAREGSKRVKARLCLEASPLLENHLGVSPERARALLATTARNRKYGKFITKLAFIQHFSSLLAVQFNESGKHDTQFMYGLFVVSTCPIDPAQMPSVARRVRQRFCILLSTSSH